MVGITLSAEQIREAPSEVRSWLEQQIAQTLGLHRPPPSVEAVARHLVGCEIAEVRAILGLIQNTLPVVSVFFELAREATVVTPQGLRVLQLDDMVRHCRLQTPDQVVACLEAINQALQQIADDPQAIMTVLDSGGHCLVADVTARSILRAWQEIVAAREAAHARPVAPDGLAPAAQPPYAISVPSSAINAGQPAS